MLSTVNYPAALMQPPRVSCHGGGVCGVTICGLYQRCGLGACRDAIKAASALPRQLGAVEQSRFAALVATGHICGTRNHTKALGTLIVYIWAVW